MFARSLVVFFILMITSIGTVSAQPQVEWVKTFGGGGVDSAYSVRQTTDGGYVLVGFTYSFGVDKNVWVIKVDADGNEEWNKVLGGDSNDGGTSS